MQFAALTLRRLSLSKSVFNLNKNFRLSKYFCFATSSDFRLLPNNHDRRTKFSTYETARYCSKNTSESVPKEDGSRSSKRAAKMMRAVREYGATVIVFHVSISLLSLGAFYLAVDNGLDVPHMFDVLGITASNFATTGSTMVIAYAAHKVFAPVRIAITLGATPVIVTYLRRVGVLKVAKK